MEEIGLGFCGCGCGGKTSVDTDGTARRYRRGHNRRCVGSGGWIEQGHRFVSVDGKKKAVHRLIVEEREGRALTRDEVVHHVDLNPLNNDPQNLVVLARREHTRLHMVGPKRKWTTDEKERAVELYVTGMSVDDVARAVGRPYSSTRQLLAGRGILRAPSETRRLRSTKEHY